MFETSVIHAEVVAEKRVGLLTASFAFHSLVVIAILANGIRTIEFPTNAPKEYTLPIFVSPVEVPPALGVPNGGHKQSTPPAAVKPTTPTADTAPRTVPDHTEQAASTSTSIADTTTTGNGSGSDQAQGVDWGVAHGVGVDGPPSTATIAPEPDVPLPVGGDVKAPVVIRRVQPVYPMLAVKARMNGTVIVECIVDKTGRVREAHVLQSTSALFDQSALQAVQQWQFAPGSLHGNAIDTIFDLTVTFHVSP
ncbi:MAG: TonB family protein [Acidobacteria bacterium]|nr:TonB family protein [Acidobacteriota bacterium]MBV9069650.1 TonB family protein [Acidobacteriota bacterium]MBV9185894.1 TonB family protein [Acidobacteriota bacterium]